jgi:CheY-like chemotaxis protein
MEEPASIRVNRDAPARRPRRAGKILLAEGNRLCQKIALRILQLESHQVTIVTTCEQVLAMLPQRTFDLILMDAELPEMTGLEATAIIRENEAATGGHIPIVAMASGSVQGNNCRRAGMDHYLNKPLDRDELRGVVGPLVPPAQVAPAFDQAAALSRLSGDRAFLCTLAWMFVEGSPSLIAEIRAAVEQQDGAAWRARPTN